MISVPPSTRRSMHTLRYRSVMCNNRLVPLELCPNVELRHLRRLYFDYLSSKVVQYPTRERARQDSAHIQYFDALEWSQDVSLYL